MKSHAVRSWAETAGALAMVLRQVQYFGAMLTQRSRYALRAMLLLARSQQGIPLPMSRLAVDAQVPRKFLEIILTDLKAAGLVASHRGKAGGFHLAKPPHLISFGDIIR